jgi:prepilin peptidase CpaA
VLSTGAFLALLTAGMVTDVRARRVPNALVVALLAAGLLSAAVGSAPAGTLVSAALGAALGLSLWLPFWVLGLLGAGDVKFFAAGAAWIGPSLAWRSALLAALLGGLFALGVLAWRRGWRHAAASVLLQAQHARTFAASGTEVSALPAAQRSLPYAVPMALALCLAALQPTALFLFGAN